MRSSVSLRQDDRGRHQPQERDQAGGRELTSWNKENGPLLIYYSFVLLVELGWICL